MWWIPLHVLQGNVSTCPRNASLRHYCHSQQNLCCALRVKGMLVWEIVKSASIGKKKWAGWRTVLPLLYRHPALFIPAQWHWVHLNGKKRARKKGRRPSSPRLSIQNSMIAKCGYASKKHLHGLHMAAAAFRLSMQMIQGQAIWLHERFEWLAQWWHQWSTLPHL